MKKPCLNCQTPFHVTRDRVSYCSWQCSKAHVKIENCAVCGEGFKKSGREIAKKYCSSACKTKAFRLKQQPKEPVKKICIDCGCEITGRSISLKIRCSECKKKNISAASALAREKYLCLIHCEECGAESGRCCRDENNKPKKTCKGRLKREIMKRKSRAKKETLTQLA